MSLLCVRSPGSPERAVIFLIPCARRDRIANSNSTGGHILPRDQDALLASPECGGFLEPGESQRLELELGNPSTKLLLCLSDPSDPAFLSLSLLQFIEPVQVSLNDRTKRGSRKKGRTPL